MRSSSWRVVVLAGLVGAVGAAVGCSDKLDTGFEPRPLGTSPTARRGYYANPYTPEAAAAQADRGGGDDMRNIRRPGSAGYR